MPELPDLEIIVDFLNNRILNKPIKLVEVLNPIILRMPSINEFQDRVKENVIKKIERFGKFLLFKLKTDDYIVLNLMLSGKLQYLNEPAKTTKSLLLRFIFLEDSELRYYDKKKMGKIYLTNDLNHIPTFSEQGPDVLEISLKEFQERVKKFRGQIKNVLVNQKFVRGIGNAYVDEILFDAGIYPFRKRTSLNDKEIEKIFKSCKKVLLDAIKILKIKMEHNIDKKIRDFLKIHNKGGEACPKCGNKISQLTPNQRITSYCKYCQK
ncbi:MAG: Fpg/Nei family DNA glycosylase [Candidatus Helarchaeota archaeon]